MIDVQPITPMADDTLEAIKEEERILRYANDEFPVVSAIALRRIDKKMQAARDKVKAILAEALNYGQRTINIARIEAEEILNEAFEEKKEALVKIIKYGEEITESIASAHAKVIALKQRDAEKEKERKESE